MELSIPLETVCRLIFRSRELEAQVPVDVADEDDDLADPDDPLALLDDDASESVEEEIRLLLDDLAEDEIAEVLALAWVGRGSYEAGEWDDALAEASEGRDQVDQLLELPMLAAYLDAGLSAFDLSCEGIGQTD